MTGHGELARERRDEEGEEQGSEGWLLSVGEKGAPWVELHEEETLGPARAGACLLPSQGRRGKIRERKEKKKGKEKIKEEKNGKIFQAWKFPGRKIKNNL
jgi:hypothetical protein